MLHLKQSSIRFINFNRLYYSITTNQYPDKYVSKIKRKKKFWQIINL